MKLAREMRTTSTILQITTTSRYNPPGPDILDPTGYWRWNIEFQQWIPTQPALQPDDVEQGVDDGVDDDDPFIATVLMMMILSLQLCRKCNS